MNEQLTVTAAYHIEIFILSLYLLVWDSLMVTVISIARRQGEGQSPDCLMDFIPQPTGQLSLENALSLGTWLSSFGA